MDKEGLWYRVLKARYGEVGGRIREGDRYALVWWNMICRVRDGVGEGVGRWLAMGGTPYSGMTLG